MAKPTRTCGCGPGCEATTRRSFAPGHDARMVTRLTGLVVADSLTLEDAARQIHRAGGSRALVTKLVQRVDRYPVRWVRSTATTLFSASGTLAAQYFGSRAVAGLPPWILVRTHYVENDIVERPEDLEVGEAIREPAFWSCTDVVLWQAGQQGRIRSVWRDWRQAADTRRGLSPSDLFDEWDWLDAGQPAGPATREENSK